MKSKDIVKQLLPGLIIGFFLGFGLIYLVGVDKENLVPNIFGGIMGCAVPTLLNGIVVLKGTAKVLDRRVSMGRAFLRNIPYIIIAGILGFLFAYGYLTVLLDIDLRTFSRVGNALLFAVVGALISTLLAYFTLKGYEKAVKYTRREK